MEASDFEVVFYVLPNGKSPFLEWLQGLKDIRARLAIDKRLARVGRGNFGDVKHFESIWELRIDDGPGYRIYFGKDGGSVVIILVAGTKKSQPGDIDRAKRYWQDYQKRSARQHALRSLPPSPSS